MKTPISILFIFSLAFLKADEVHLSSVCFGGDQKLTQKVLDQVKNDAKYIDGNFVRKSLNELGDNLATLLTRIDNLPNLSSVEKNALKTDINSSAELKNLFAKNIDKTDELSDAWNILKKSYTNPSSSSTLLFRNADAVGALAKIRKNPKLTELGLTDDILGQIRGYGTGTSSASYAEVINDLDNLGNFLKSHNGTSLENFTQTINILKGSNDNYKQGVHWMIKDVSNDANTFGGRILQFEHSVPNARGTTSFIDVRCPNCEVQNLLVEYKSGPNSITSSTIKEQFIERDLFNATSLDKLQWRTTNVGMTKEKLVSWLTDNKSSIESLEYDKIKSFFPNDNFMTKDNFADRFISKFNDESFYNSIFK